MKAYIILINWVLSFMALCIDTEESSFTAVVIVMLWFGVSTLLFIRAQRRGMLEKIEKRFKINNNL